MEGNQMKMREALEFCSRIIGANGIRGNVFIDDIQEAHRAITAALAAPPRQCDVGTAEEQAERFARYCDTEVCKRNRCKTQAKALVIDSCALRWSQMPYEEEEGAEHGEA